MEEGTRAGCSVGSELLAARGGSHAPYLAGKGDKFRPGIVRDGVADPAVDWIFWKHPSAFFSPRTPQNG